MTAPTVSAPTVAGDRPRSTRRQSAAVERWLLEHGQNRRFALRTTGDGRCYLTDVPDDGALVSAGRDLALLASADLL